MTLGARIAQKRKELGLSQEALGEKLCVSRQAIYKWEADAALPEIEKLVALSQLFAVPVGWLLGVEEKTEAETGEAEETSKGSGELNEAQIKMVEEIVNRYLAAQPQPKRARRWPRLLAAALILVVGVHLFNRLDGLDRQYDNLQNTMGDLKWSVNNQIGGIAGRVEEILKSQNDLTADYRAELVRTDLPTNTATFSLRAVPKTFVEGMRAVFMADSGTGLVEVPGTLFGGTVFTAEITTELTDEIALTVVFITPDGQRQTQLLCTYTGLLSDSIPYVNISDDFLWEDAPGGMVQVGKRNHNYVHYVEVRTQEAKVEGAGLVTAEHFRVGVFVNQKLVAWAQECEKPESYQGDWDGVRFFRMPDITVTLGEGDELCTAALVTDNYGRQFMAFHIPVAVEYDEKSDGELDYVREFHYSSNVADWVLTEGAVPYTVGSAAN